MTSKLKSELLKLGLVGLVLSSCVTKLWEPIDPNKSRRSRHISTNSMTQYRAMFVKPIYPSNLELTKIRAMRCKEDDCLEAVKSLYEDLKDCEEYNREGKELKLCVGKKFKNDSMKSAWIEVYDEERSWVMVYNKWTDKYVAVRKDRWLILDGSGIKLKDKDNKFVYITAEKYIGAAIGLFLADERVKDLDY